MTISESSTSKDLRLTCCSRIRSTFSTAKSATSGSKRALTRVRPQQAGANELLVGIPRDAVLAISARNCCAVRIGPQSEFLHSALKFSVGKRNPVPFGGLHIQPFFNQHFFRLTSKFALQAEGSKQPDALVDLIVAYSFAVDLDGRFD